MSDTLPKAPGVGFKSQHLSDLADPGPVAWLEVHAENYMSEGGPRMAMLDDIASRFPLSVHGVGLSIGGESPLDRTHLARLRRLLDRVNPRSFSEHLAWSTHEGAYLNDLLPLPYTNATLSRVVQHVDEVQQALGRQMLLENPSSYLAFEESTWSETEFLAETARRTGCGMLLDINNVFISATNLQISAEVYLDAYPIGRVGEIHLGGHAEQQDAHGAPLLIDDHGAPVADRVWSLYARTIAQSGPCPTLIEWDNDVPPFATLRAEAARASAVLSGDMAA